MARPYHLFTYGKAARTGFTVIGHRGACAYYPENTVVSLQGAIQLGAEMAEVDVQLTRDGVPVLFHDKNLERCTGVGGRISDLGYNEVRKLDAGAWFHPRFKGVRIPSLREACEFCRDRIALNIEIKAEAVSDGARGGVEEKCIETVTSCGMHGHVIYSSFDPRALAHLREIDPSAAVAVLYDRPWWTRRAPSRIVRETGADAFNCSRREISRRWMADLLENSIPINVYTVNDERGMRRLIAMGVSGIFTNRPDVLRRVAGETQARAETAD